MPRINLNGLSGIPKVGPQQDQADAGPSTDTNSLPADGSSPTPETPVVHPTIEAEYASPDVNVQGKAADEGQASESNEPSDTVLESTTAGTSQPPRASSYAGDLPDDSWIYLLAGSSVLLGIALFWMLSKFLASLKKRKPKIKINVDPAKEVRGQFKRATRFESKSEVNNSDDDQTDSGSSQKSIAEAELDATFNSDSEEFDFSAELDEEDSESDNPKPSGSAALKKQSQKAKGPKQAASKKKSKQQSKVKTMALANSNEETLRNNPSPSESKSKFENPVFDAVHEDDFTVDEEDSELYDDSVFDMESSFGQGDLDMDSSADEDSEFEAEIRASESNRFFTGTSDEDLSASSRDDEEAVMNLRDDDSDAEFDFELDGEEVEFGDSDSNFDFDMEEEQESVGAQNVDAQSPPEVELENDSESADWDAMIGNDDLAEPIEGNVEVDSTDDVPAFAGQPAGTLDVGVEDESEDYSDMFGDDEELENSIADDFDQASDDAGARPQEAENAEDAANLLPDAGISSIAHQAQELVTRSPEGLIDTSTAKVAAGATAGGLMSRLFGWMRRKQPADTSSIDGMITNLNEQVAAASDDVIEMPLEAVELSLENEVESNLPDQLEKDSQAVASADPDVPEDANESFQLDAPMAVSQSRELDSDADDNFALFDSVDESADAKKPMSSRDTIPDPLKEAATGIVEAFSADDLEVSNEVASASHFSSADTLRDPVSNETDDEGDFSAAHTRVVETKLHTDELDSASVATAGGVSELRFDDQRELELTSKIDELSAENAKLSQTVNSLQAKVEETDASLLEMANLAKQLEAKELENRDLLASLESTKTEVEETKSETATQLEFTNKIETELNELREKVATLESDNDGLSSQLAEAKSSLAEKDTVLAKTDAVVAEKDSLLTDKDSLLADKDALLAEKDAVLAEKESALAQQDAKPEAELAEASSLEVADLKRRFEMRLKAERKARKDAQHNLEQAEEQRNDIALALRSAKKELTATKEAIADTSKPEST